MIESPKNINMGNKGFTLIELIVAIFVMSLVMTAVMIMISVSLKEYAILAGDVNMQQNGQISMEYIGDIVMESSSPIVELKNDKFHAYAVDSNDEQGNPTVNVLVVDKEHSRLLTRNIKAKDMGILDVKSLSNKNPSTGTAKSGNFNKNHLNGRKVPLADLPEGLIPGYVGINDDFNISDDMDIKDNEVSKEIPKNPPVIPNTSVPPFAEAQPVDPKENIEIDQENPSENPLESKKSSTKYLSSKVTSDMIFKVISEPEKYLLSEEVEDLTLKNIENSDLIPVVLKLKIGNQTQVVNGKYRIRNKIKN